MPKKTIARRVTTSRYGRHNIIMITPKLWRLFLGYPVAVSVDFVEASHTHRGSKVWIMPTPDQQTASTLDLAVKRTVSLAYLHAAIGRAFYLGGVS